MVLTVLRASLINENFFVFAVNHSIAEDYEGTLQRTDDLCNITTLCNLKTFLCMVTCLALIVETVLRLMNGPRY